MISLSNSALKGNALWILSEIICVMPEPYPYKKVHKRRRHDRQKNKNIQIGETDNRMANINKTKF